VDSALFHRDVAALDSVFRFMTRFFEREELDEAVEYSLNLVVEEIFTNMVKYNTGTDSDIRLELGRNHEGIVLELIDRDVDPFDPSSFRADVDKPVEQRTPGGLGLYLVNSLVDRISYEYRNREMKVSVTKMLE
jgi:anti-sigma regulatory factor (Ser/Thr protein kinase)